MWREGATKNIVFKLRQFTPDKLPNSASRSQIEEHKTDLDLRREQWYIFNSSVLQFVIGIYRFKKKKSILLLQNGDKWGSLYEKYSEILIPIAKIQSIINILDVFVRKREYDIGKECEEEKVANMN